MKRIRLVICLLVLLSGPRLFAARTVDQMLYEASALEQSDEPNRAIQLVRAILDSSRLTNVQQVDAWNILGLSYSDKEDFGNARKAFKRALSFVNIEEGDSSTRSRYADLLSNLAACTAKSINPMPQRDCVSRHWLCINQYRTPPASHVVISIL
jgi:hypothetical protein